MWLLGIELRPIEEHSVLLTSDPSLLSSVFMFLKLLHNEHKPTLSIEMGIQEKNFFKSKVLVQKLSSKLDMLACL